MTGFMLGTATALALAAFTYAGLNFCATTTAGLYSASNVRAINAFFESVDE